MGRERGGVPGNATPSAARESGKGPWRGCHMRVEHTPTTSGSVAVVVRVDDRLGQRAVPGTERDELPGAANG